MNCGPTGPSYSILFTVTMQRRFGVSAFRASHLGFVFTGPCPLVALSVSGSDPVTVMPAIEGTADMDLGRPELGEKGRP
jgi:hypothetical protein